jgi:putative ABC transport system ATP-binding protein
MGPSGSGKSTLLHILGCLDSLDSGEVWLDGDRVDSLSRRDLARLRRNEVGFIFQTFNLVQSLTAIENVMLAAEYAGKGRREARGLARNALAQVALADREGHRPTELSGGQQQRVAVARAIVANPSIVLADEPTANLDSKTGEDLLILMKEMNENRGVTFIFSTHDKMVMEYARRLIEIRDGRVAFDHVREN